MNWCAILPWIIGIGSAILGGLIGYFLRRPQLLFYKSSLEKKSNDYDTLYAAHGELEAEKTELEGVNANLASDLNSANIQLKDFRLALDKIEGEKQEYAATIDKLQADLDAKDTALQSKGVELSTAINAENDRIAQLEAELATKANLQNEIDALQAQLEAKEAALLAGSSNLSDAEIASKARIDALQAQLDAREKELNAEIAGLQTKLEAAAENENRIVELESLLATKVGLDAKIDKLQADLDAKEAELMADGKLTADEAVVKARIDTLQEQLAAREQELQSEIEMLRKELADKEAAGGGMVLGTGGFTADQDAILADIKANAVKIPYESLGHPEEHHRDNFLKIENITPWQEAKLNAAGINCYKQLARLQDDELAIMAEVAQLDADTIKSEDWKGQARAILAAIAAAAHKDKLRKIEGIGPKIEQLFHDNGIYTFRDLAESPVSVLKHVLKEGGARFRLANPGSWPRQAQLAADGDWEALKKLQDELDGGR